MPAAARNRDERLPTFQFVRFGAARTAGFALPGDYCPDPTTFAPWPECGLEVHRLLSLIEHLRLPTAA